MDNPKINQIVRNMADLGVLIRKKRIATGLTQAQAAALCNVSTPFFSMLENGKESMRIHKVLQVIQGLGLEVTITERGMPIAQ